MREWKVKKIVMEKYSVVLLKEAKIKQPLIVGDKIFEESIILCTLPEFFFDDTPYEDILNYFINNIPPDVYQNSHEEVVSNEVVAVIDAYNILSDVVFEEFSEVYSRHFIEKDRMSVDDIIKKYYFDFSFGNK